MTNKELYFELRGVIADVEESGFDDVCLETIKRVADALARTEPEPVAWLFQNEETGLTECVDTQQVEWGFEKNNPRWQKIMPLYPAPPQREWQGLTDDDIEDVCWTEVDQRLRSFARAIEAKLKEKNG